MHFGLDPLVQYMLSRRNAGVVVPDKAALIAASNSLSPSQIVQAVTNLVATPVRQTAPSPPAPPATTEPAPVPEAHPDPIQVDPGGYTDALKAQADGVLDLGGSAWDSVGGASVWAVVGLALVGGYLVYRHRAGPRALAGYRRRTRRTRKSRR